MKPQQPGDQRRPTDTLRAEAEDAGPFQDRELLALSAEEACKLVRELRERQSELESQNEELHRAQVALTEARDRYEELYEFAPVGYLTLDREGVIREANRTAATLLGCGQSELAGRDFGAFVDPESQDHWHLYRGAVLTGETMRSCELMVLAEDGSVRAVRLESIAFGPAEDRGCRTALLDVTEQKEAEAALEDLSVDLGNSLAGRSAELKDSVAKIKLLTEAVSNLGEGIMITGDELDWPGPEIIFVNDALCRITGYTKEELIGQTPRILQGSKTDRKVLDRMRADLSAGRPFSAELVNHRKDGTPYNAEIFITPLVDDTGSQVHFVSIHRDITARKERERVLRDRRERLQAILNAAVDAIITIDRDGTIVSANPATERIFGYAESKLIGQNVKILMPSPYREEHDDYLARYQETDEARIIGIGREVTGLRKDGSTFPVDLAVSEVRGLGLYTGIVRDITDRKAAREALRHEHELNEKIIATAQNIVLVLDPEGRVVRFNPYFEKLSGWRLDEAKGRDWFRTFLPERDRERIAALFGESLGGVPTRGNINAILTKDGTERVIEWNDAVLSDNDGNVTGLLCTGSDVTERRQLEQEVINAAEEERQRIAHDLHDDLGSLLTGIKLSTECIAATLEREGSAQAERARAAARLVADAIARTRSIARGLRPVGSDPEDLLSALRGLAERTSVTTGMECQFDCPGSVMVIDPIRAQHLYRIAQEAVNNATKYSGGTEVSISLHKRNGTIELVVEDNGSGFDQEEERSAGLGLHIMRYRANAMNGTLRIANAEPSGSRVVCVVPAA